MANIETIRDIIGLPDHMKIYQLDEQGKETKPYTVLVNPESYSVVHETDYTDDQFIGAQRSTFSFNKLKASTMNLKLLFDSTGSLGSVPILNKQSVLEQINLFLSTAFYVDDSDKENPKKLKLIWGPMEFMGVLSSVNISYSHFDPTGAPIRATAICTFSGGEVKFDKPEPKKPLFKKKNKKPKVIDFAKEKHAINGVLKYGTYMAVVSQQPKEAMPKSLRLVEEVAKMIIR